VKIVLGAVVMTMCAALAAAQAPSGNHTYAVTYVRTDRQLKIGISFGAKYYSYNETSQNTQDHLIQKLNAKGFFHVEELKGACCKITIELLELAQGESKWKAGFDLSATVTLADAKGQQLYFKGYRGEGRTAGITGKSLLDRAADNLAENIVNDTELIRLLTEKSAADTVVPPVAAPTEARIGSIPDGGEIEINEAYSGNTPSTFSLAPGEYRIAINKDGYGKWERSVKVGAGAAISINAELVAIAAATQVAPAPAPNVSPETEKARPAPPPTAVAAPAAQPVPEAPPTAAPSPADHALALYRQCVAGIGDGSLIIFTLNTVSQAKDIAPPVVSEIGFARGLEIKKGEVIALPHAIDAAGPIASVFHAGEVGGKKAYYAAVKPGPIRLFSALWFKEGTYLLTQGTHLDVQPGRSYVLGDITVEMNSAEGMAFGNTVGSAVLKWSKNDNLAVWFETNYCRKAPPNRFVSVTVPPKPILAFKGVYMKSFADGNFYSFADFRTDEELILAVDDPKDDPGNRQNAISELGSRKCKAAVNSLVKCLADPESKVREAAVEALGSIGGDDATKALKQVAAENANESLGNKALAALENIEADARLAAVKKLTDQAALADIAKTDRAPRVRGAAVQKLTDQALLADIEKNDKDADVRALAHNRLNHLVRAEQK
jgi:hypothetical protein